MTRSERIGIIGGFVGAAFGSVAWLIVFGIIVRWPFAAAAPFVLAGLGVIGAIRLLDAYPERRLTAAGLLLLWIAAINLVFLNVLWDRIPETVNRMPTGKTPTGMLWATVVILGLAALGLALFVKDRLAARRQ